MATAPKAPVWSSFFGGADVPNYGIPNFTRMLSQSDLPQNQAKINEVVSKVGSVDKYLQGIKNYEAAYQDYLLDYRKFASETYSNTPISQDRVDELKKQKEDVLAQTQKQIDAAKKAQIDAAQESRNLREARYTNLRQELETQYNNLVGLDSRFGYAGRNSDLPTVFNQQAAQLADAGVMSIADLRIKDGQLYDAANRRVVTNSNLGGQVYVDRDTGVQKWGDIFSGVKGGANYGIMQAPDGSVLLFPAWEKTKSLAAQIGGSTLEKYITPLLTIGGALLAGPVGGSAVAGAALGAGAGSTAGQLLASGKVDWEKVALSAGGAAAGQAIFGPGAAGAGEAGGSGISAGAGGETGLLAGSGGVTGITPPAGFELAPNLGAGAGAGLLGPSEIDLLGGTDFSRVGETGLTPGAAGEGIQVVVPPGGGAATVPGLEAPGLSAMGGAQGITVPIQGGGVVSEMGFVPPGATPSLGDPGSFINNPDYLGSPVISEDYLGLTASDMPSGISVQDALRGARLANSLLGQPQQGGLLGGGAAPYQAQGVDYSGLLSLLQGQARTPGVSPLIAPVVNPMASPYDPLLGQPMQYQPLTRSLL